VIKRLKEKNSYSWFSLNNFPKKNEREKDKKEKTTNNKVQRDKILLTNPISN